MNSDQQCVGRGGGVGGGEVLRILFASNPASYNIRDGGFLGRGLLSNNEQSLPVACDGNVASVRNKPYFQPL
jgi:hypothetical protein